MKLYYSPGACSLSPHIVLNEMGISYEPIKVDLKNKSDEFKKQNPKGYVPALWTEQHGLLTEGTAVVQYLADLKPESRMIPAPGSWERYKAIEMLNFVATEFHKGYGPLWGASRMVQGQDAQDQLKQFAIQKLSLRFEYMAKILNNQTYLMGETFTVCDAYFFTMLTWTKPHQIDLTPFPQLLGYFERVQNRPAVQKTLQIEGLK